MSCYFRHLKDILSEAGVEVTPGNRQQIDDIMNDSVDLLPTKIARLPRKI